MYLWLFRFSFVFGFEPLLVWVGFFVFFLSPSGFVRFSLVVKGNGSGLWVLEKIR